VIIQLFNSTRIPLDVVRYCKTCAKNSRSGPPSERWSSRRCKDTIMAGIVIPGVSVQDSLVGPPNILICKAYLAHPSAAGGWFRASITADSVHAHQPPVHRRSSSAIRGCLATSRPASIPIDQQSSFKYIAPYLKGLDQSANPSVVTVNPSYSLILGEQQLQK
jgi:hypothetical protein